MVAADTLGLGSVLPPPLRPLCISRSCDIAGSDLPSDRVSMLGSYGSLDMTECTLQRVKLSGLLRPDGNQGEGQVNHLTPGITGHAPYLPSDTQIAPSCCCTNIGRTLTYLHSFGLSQNPFSLLQPAAHLAETEEHVRFIYAVIYTTAGWVARPTLLIYGICGGWRGVFSGCDCSILWL